ncbi:MAG: type VI secretion system tube protein Hcp [Longimicrobiales bacterium]
MDIVLMKVTDVKGQTQLDGYADHMELFSYNHGIAQHVTANVSNTDRTTGRPQHSDFSVSKDVDKASPSLLQGCNEAKVYSEVLITVGRNDGGAIVKLFTYKLEDVVISSISVSGGGGGKPVENISLNYARIEWTYYAQKEEGGAGGNAVAKWDVSLNKAS